MKFLAPIVEGQGEVQALPTIVQMRGAMTMIADPLAKPLVDGAAELGFTRRDGVTRLAHLYQHDPLRVLFPRVEAGEPPEAVLVTTSGGLVGGDRLRVAVTVGAGAAARVVGQAAEKIYRSAGADGLIEVGIKAGADAWVEWLPQETILFEGARLRRVTRLELASGARALAGEMLVFGRRARGERLTTGLVRDAWELRRDGRLVWADSLHLDGDIAALLAATAGFDGAAAGATLVHGGDDAGARLDLARGLAEAAVGCRAGVSLVHGVLVMRWLGAEPLSVRRAFGDAWTALRADCGWPARLPRLWEV